MLPLDLLGPSVGVLVLCYCGFAGSRDELCFFSCIGGGSNMRYVSGGACLVGAARPPRNKLLQVFVHLVAKHSGGGGRPVRFELLVSVALAGAVEGVGSCIGALARHLLVLSSSCLWCCCLPAPVDRAGAARLVVATRNTKLKDSTADVQVSSTSCSNPRFGVRSLLWRVPASGLQLQRLPRRGDDGLQRILMKEEDGTVTRGFFVICLTFMGLCASKGVLCDHFFLI